MQSTSSDNSVDNDLAPENLQGFLRAENIMILDILAFGDTVARWQVAGAPWPAPAPRGPWCGQVE